MKTMMRWCLSLLAPAFLMMSCAGAEDFEQAGTSEESTRQSPLAPSFFGQVKGSLKGEPLAGAQVTINGITRVTDSTGRYTLSVEDSRTGYSISVSKFGFETQGIFVTAPSQQGEVHILKPAFVATVDTARDTTVVDQNSGVRVLLKANTLVYPDGKRVTGLARVALSSYQPLAMPGDFTAVTLQNQPVALESVGAFTVSAVDGQSVAVNLATGATAEAFIPLPAAVGKMPSCIFNGSCRVSLWRFNNTNGRWFDQRATNMRVTTSGTTFTMTGGPAFAGGSSEIMSNGGLGTWNADIEKAAPACTIIDVNNIPPECFDFTINVKLQNSSGVLVPSSRTVVAGTRFVALYNIPANVDQEVGIEFPATAPAYCAGNLHFFSNPAPTDATYPIITGTGGTTKFSSGGPWGGVGFPTDSGGSPLDYSDVAAGDYKCQSTVTISSI